MRHIPVLLTEVMEGLNLMPGAKVVDGTLGDAGHAEKILEKIGPKGKLLGIDADPESLLRAKQYLYNWHDQIIFVRDNFVNLKKIIQENKFGMVNAILLDLGWSSPQFEERGRGFSFQKDEGLDMRYSPNVIPAKAGIRDSLGQIPAFAGMTNGTASELVNEASVDELTRIFHIYGEEKFAGEIAAAIGEARRVQLIEKTGQLVEIILAVYRQMLHTDKDIPRMGNIHPATKVFQALRIAVNNELDVIKQTLPQALECLAPGGRLAVITFHSLEDRIVKQYFAGQENKTIKLVNKKPITASDTELTANPRARSAKLRVVERLSS